MAKTIERAINMNIYRLVYCPCYIITIYPSPLQRFFHSSYYLSLSNHFWLILKSHKILSSLVIFTILQSSSSPTLLSAHDRDPSFPSLLMLSSTSHLPIELPLRNRESERDREREGPRYNWRPKRGAAHTSAPTD